MREDNISVRADELLVSVGWYEAMQAHEEHEVVERLADEIVRLREALAATSRVLVLDEETAGDRLCPLAIVNDFGRVVCGVHYEKDADATFWDRSQPLGAPHRVVRVALVDADDMGERGVKVTDEMVERAAEALYDLHEDWEVNRFGKPTSASKSWVHADGETRSVRYQQARIALTAALEVPRD